MTFNMHLLLHLRRSVLDCGPLWCHNSHAFESGNGNLLKVIQAAKDFFSTSRVSASWLKKLNLPGQSFSFKKMVKNGCLSMSSGKSNKCTDNSHAQLKTGHM